MLSAELTRRTFGPFSATDSIAIKDRNGSEEKNRLRRAFVDACAIRTEDSSTSCAAEQLWGDGSAEFAVQQASKEEAAAAAASGLASLGLAWPGSNPSRVPTLLRITSFRAFQT